VKSEWFSNRWLMVFLGYGGIIGLCLFELLRRLGRSEIPVLSSVNIILAIVIALVCWRAVKRGLILKQLENAAVLGDAKRMFNTSLALVAVSAFLVFYTLGVKTMWAVCELMGLNPLMSMTPYLFIGVIGVVFVGYWIRTRERLRRIDSEATHV